MVSVLLYVRHGGQNEERSSGTYNAAPTILLNDDWLPRHASHARRRVLDALEEIKSFILLRFPYQVIN